MPLQQLLHICESGDYVSWCDGIKGRTSNSKHVPFRVILMSARFLKNIVNMLASAVHQRGWVSSDAFGLQVGMQGAIELVSIKIFIIEVPAVKSESTAM